MFLTSVISVFLITQDQDGKLLTFRMKPGLYSMLPLNARKLRLSRKYVNT